MRPSEWVVAGGLWVAAILGAAAMAFALAYGFITIQ